MNEKFYLDMAGGTAGPFNLEQVRAMYIAGAVTGETLYSQPDAVQWLPLRTIEALLQTPQVAEESRAVIAPPPLPKAKPVARRGDYYCTACGTVGRPVKGPVKGTFAMEALLWLLFCFPGVIYSFWRLFGRGKVCPACESPKIIPATSPKARERLG
jgi:hypothetical protein